jgi:hypothetical protein
LLAFIFYRDLRRAWWRRRPGYVLIQLCIPSCFTTCGIKSWRSCSTSVRTSKTCEQIKVTDYAIVRLLWADWLQKWHISIVIMTMEVASWPDTQNPERISVVLPTVWHSTIQIAHRLPCNTFTNQKRTKTKPVKLSCLAVWGRSSRRISGDREKIMDRLVHACME